jgi:hypothetical protein
MASIKIVFVSRKRTGGYGDRLIGMASAVTLARMLNAEFFFHWEAEFMSLCQPTASNLVSLPPIDETLALGNQHHSPVLETEHLLERWAGKTIAIEANIPCDIHLWKNPFFQETLATRPYEQEALQSFRTLFTQHIQLSHPLFSSVRTQTFDCGIQIRCGDPYCMPHALAEQYIPESNFATFAQKLKAYLILKGIQGRIYVTCDTFHMYKHFTALNDESYTFVFRDRKDDIHFDFWNSNNRYAEVLVDHLMLMQCKEVITGLRSNFGTSGAYCSTLCKTIHFYTSDWSEPCKVNFLSFPTESSLVLKEYKNNFQTKTGAISSTDM